MCLAHSRFSVNVNYFIVTVELMWITMKFSVCLSQTLFCTGWPGLWKLVWWVPDLGVVVIHTVKLGRDDGQRGSAVGRRRHESRVPRVYLCLHCPADSHFNCSLMSHLFKFTSFFNGAIFNVRRAENKLSSILFLLLWAWWPLINVCWVNSDDQLFAGQVPNYVRDPEKK